MSHYFSSLLRGLKLEQRPRFESVVEGAEIMLKKCWFGLATCDKDAEFNWFYLMLIFGFVLMWIVYEIIVQWNGKRKANDGLESTSLTFVDEYEDVVFGDKSRTISTQTFVSLKEKHMFICIPSIVRREEEPQSEDTDLESYMTDSTIKAADHQEVYYRHVSTSDAATETPLTTLFKNPFISRIPVIVQRSALASASASAQVLKPKSR